MLDKKTFIVTRSIFGGSSGGSDGSGSSNDLYPPQKTSFTVDSTYAPFYTHWIYENMFDVVEGEQYLVEWDGVAYVCKAVKGMVDQMTGNAIGNLSLLGLGEDTGEPFIIAYFDVLDGGVMFTADTSESHMVRVADVNVVESGGEGELVAANKISLRFPSKLFTIFYSYLNNGAEEYGLMPMYAMTSTTLTVNSGIVGTNISFVPITTSPTKKTLSVSGDLATQYHDAYGIIVKITGTAGGTITIS